MAEEQGTPLKEKIEVTESKGSSPTETLLKASYHIIHVSSFTFELSKSMKGLIKEKAVKAVADKVRLDVIEDMLFHAGTLTESVLLRNGKVFILNDPKLEEPLLIIHPSHISELMEAREWLKSKDLI